MIDLPDGVVFDWCRYVGDGRLFIFTDKEKPHILALVQYAKHYRPKKTLQEWAKDTSSRSLQAVIMGMSERIRDTQSDIDMLKRELERRKKG